MYQICYKGSIKLVDGDGPGPLIVAFYEVVLCPAFIRMIMIIIPTNLTVSSTFQMKIYQIIIKFQRVHEFYLFVSNYICILFLLQFCGEPVTSISGGYIGTEEPELLVASFSGRIFALRSGHQSSAAVLSKLPQDALTARRAKLEYLQLLMEQTKARQCLLKMSFMALI